MIREYRPEDQAEVLTVWASASAVGHPFLTAEFLAIERQNIADVYLSSAETWVWEADGRVAGFVALVANEVGGLFVDPMLHGRGIGRALVDHARGLRGELEVEVFEENAVGRAFYDACGFVERSRDNHRETGLAVIRLVLPSPEPPMEGC
jgi:putative acetyltransferase